MDLAAPRALISCSQTTFAERVAREHYKHRCGAIYPRLTTLLTLRTWTICFPVLCNGEHAQNHFTLCRYRDQRLGRLSRQAMPDLPFSLTPSAGQGIRPFSTVLRARRLRTGKFTITTLERKSSVLLWLHAEQLWERRK